MRAPRTERDRPPGLPMRTMLCGLCRRDDVAEVDRVLALGGRVRGVSAASQRRHTEAHLWAWVLDAPDAARARAVVAELTADLAERGLSPVSVSAIAALTRIDRWLYPQHVELARCRREALRGQGRLFRDAEVDPAELAMRVAAERVRARVESVERCSCRKLEGMPWAGEMK